MALGSSQSGFGRALPGQHNACAAWQQWPGVTRPGAGSGLVRACCLASGQHSANPWQAAARLLADGTSVRCPAALTRCFPYTRSPKTVFLSLLAARSTHIEADDQDCCPTSASRSTST